MVRTSLYIWEDLVSVIVFKILNLMKLNNNAEIIDNTQQLTASMSHSRVAVIKTKNCKFESNTNQHKSK